MRIAVIGAGAMGALFGGYLSRCNDVLLVDVNPKQVDAINEKGLTIHEESIVGAGSVVIRNIPAHCTAVGNPCKVIKEHVVS